MLLPISLWSALLKVDPVDSHIDTLDDRNRVSVGPNCQVYYGNKFYFSYLLSGDISV
jgi:hypothetical protein